jgi:hypothetical protein
MDARIRIGIQPKMLDLDLDPESMNTDRKHWKRLARLVSAELPLICPNIANVTDV